jgi:hypothetical protein
MPTQILPAASLRSARCLPAARALLRVANYLIYTVLWSIGRGICRVAPNFLPALREGEGADPDGVSVSRYRMLDLHHQVAIHQYCISSMLTPSGAAT